jgi:ornithine cyclodeaminase
MCDAENGIERGGGSEMTTDLLPEFVMISGTVIRTIIEREMHAVTCAVEEAYCLHQAGKTVNPDSYFLSFPDKAGTRIIALPAYLGGRFDVAGLKWIASFPDNIRRALPRASAVLILNNYVTGYPFACLESSLISAARTAASAVLAAYHLNGCRREGRSLAVIGAGILARNILTHLAAQAWRFERVVVHDVNREYSEAMADHCSAIGQPIAYRIEIAPDVGQAIRSSDVVLFATTAGAPYVTDASLFEHHPLVLNISLRDLSPDIILGAFNIMDDVEHCLKANTSPYLAEQQSRSRDFIAGTIAQVLAGDVGVPMDRTRIFSPFGLGILDLAVGKLVYDIACSHGDAVKIDGFFAETRRW